MKIFYTKFDIYVLYELVWFTYFDYVDRCGFHHDTAEIFLKVALNTKNQPKPLSGMLKV
jgi:hypothetical protein